VNSFFMKGTLRVLYTFNHFPTYMSKIDTCCLNGKVKVAKYMKMDIIFYLLLSGFYFIELVIRIKK